MKKIKQNGNAILKAGLGYTIGNYMIKGLTFFSIPIFARLLSPDNYGIYNTYIAYESILCMCVGFTLNTCQKNARYKYGKDYGEFVSSCMVLLLVSAGTWLLLIKMFERPLTAYTGFDYWIHNLLILHCLGSAILSIFNVYLSITYSYKGYLLAAGFNAVFNIGLSILLIKTVFSRHPAEGRIVGTVIPVLFLAVFICLYFWKEKRPPADRTTNFRYWRFALAYSVPLIPHGISQVLLNQFDRIMINSICGAAQAGIYSFAYNIYSIVGVTTASLENVWSPWFFEKAQIGEIGSIEKRATQYAVMVALFVSSIMLVSPELIVILGTSSYTGAEYCVIPILVGGFFAFLYTIPVQVQYFYGKTKLIALGTVVAAMINIVLNSIFIPMYGYVAAAYTTAVTYGMNFAFHAFISSRIGNVHYFKWSGLFLSGGLCVTVAAIAVTLVSYIEFRLGVLAVLLFCAFSYWKSVSRKADIQV